MKHLCLTFVCIFILGIPSALADKETRDFADFQSTFITSVIKSVKQSLQEAASTLERNSALDEMTQHSTLVKFAERTPSLRALIATDKLGSVYIDSTLYPSRRESINDRIYVQQAFLKTDKSFYISPPLISRRTNRPFIAVSRALLDINKESIGTLSAIITPALLIKSDLLCQNCTVSIYDNSYKKIVSYPDSFIHTGSFIQELQKRDLPCEIDFEQDGNFLTSSTFQINEFNLFVVVSKMKTS